MKQVKLICAAALALAAGLCQAQAHPTNYPAKPVRIVVPFPAGGAVDLLGRLLAPKLAESLGQPFLVENRSGAAGNLGTEAVARAAPDGYTILLNTNGHAIGPAIYRKLGYDPVNDFIPVSQMVTSNLVLVAYPQLPAASLADFIALARAKPGGLNYGSTGVGNALHLTMELLKLSAGIDVVSIPYQGDAPLNAALMSGQVEVAVVPYSTASPLIRSGKLRALAVASPKRMALQPDVPTVAETLPGFESTTWVGLFVPAKTPREIVDAIHRATVKGLAAADVRERLASISSEPVGSTPEQFKAKVDADVAKFTKIVKEARIPLQE
jgi:tripartite-type tricarboxylate transporter receptor subunit TctC